MGFDVNLFALDGMTKSEAIDYLRQIKEPLSPRAAAAVADIFDPKQDTRGRKKADTPVNTLYFLGRLRALRKHGLFKINRGDSLERIAARECKETTFDALKRAMLTDARLHHDLSFLIMTFKLYGAGVIQKLKIPKNISDDVFFCALDDAIISETITKKQAQEIKKNNK